MCWQRLISTVNELHHAQNSKGGAISKKRSRKITTNRDIPSCNEEWASRLFGRQKAAFRVDELHADVNVRVQALLDGHRCAAFSRRLRSSAVSRTPNGMVIVIPIEAIRRGDVVCMSFCRHAERPVKSIWRRWATIASVVRTHVPRAAATRLPSAKNSRPGHRRSRGVRGQRLARRDIAHRAAKRTVVGKVDLSRHNRSPSTHVPTGNYRARTGAGE